VSDTLDRREERVIERVLRTLRMDADTYDRVQRDESLTGEALALVAFAALASGVGALLSTGLPEEGPAGVISAFIGLIVGALATAAVWLLLTAVALLVGSTLFRGMANMGGLMRATAYAFVPTALNLFSFVPIVGAWCEWIAGLWALLLGAVAVRQAMRLNLWRTVGTVVVSLLVMLAPLVLAGVLFTALGG
jgi:hypothetical protein